MELPTLSTAFNTCKDRDTSILTKPNIWDIKTGEKTSFTRYHIVSPPERFRKASKLFVMKVLLGTLQLAHGPPNWNKRAGRPFTARDLLAESFTSWLG